MPRMDSRKNNFPTLWSGIVLVLVTTAVQAQDQGPKDTFGVEAVNYIRNFAFPKPLKAPKDEILFEHAAARTAPQAEAKAPSSDVGAASPTTAPAATSAPAPSAESPAPAPEEKRE